MYILDWVHGYSGEPCDLWASAYFADDIFLVHFGVHWIKKNIFHENILFFFYKDHKIIE